MTEVESWQVQIVMKGERRLLWEKGRKRRLAAGSDILIPTVRLAGGR